MELQLGLGLPSNNNNNPTITKGLTFDLNCYVYEPKEVLLSNPTPCFHAAPPPPPPPFCYTYNDIININKKRSFGQAFDHHNTTITVPRTLPLLLSNNQPNEEEDHPKHLHTHSFFTLNSSKNDGDANGVVGWPPIKSWRKRLNCHDNQGGLQAENNRTVGGRGSGSGSMYVKVNMEGVAIARKVDLSLHHSFQTLKPTLMDMFGKWLSETGHQEYSYNYNLAYQDREGDWLFTQDVPWRSFILSVQRLKLLKSSG